MYNPAEILNEGGLDNGHVEYEDDADWLKSTVCELKYYVK